MTTTKAGRKGEEKRQWYMPTELVPRKELSWKPQLLFISRRPDHVRMPWPRSAWKCVTIMDIITVPLLRQKRRTVLVKTVLCEQPNGVCSENICCLSIFPLGTILEDSLWVVDVSISFSNPGNFFFKCFLNAPLFVCLFILAPLLVSVWIFLFFKAYQVLLFCVHLFA